MISAIVLAVVIAVSAIASGDKAAPEMKMDPKQAEMMKAWHAASTPGGEHEKLKLLIGKWKVSTKSWESEGGKPEETTGTATFKAILGGRFVQQDFKGKMMGQPYEGTGIMGYNNVTQKFESTWYDSMSTASMHFEGTMDPSTQVIAEKGEFVCPIKKTSQKMRSEFKISDKNNANFTLWMPDMVTSKEYKGMEQVYKRL